ncbi:hypothetical protein [Streptosporangium lutulentum]|uniref:Uncharacterized protein n=1 Tax=Streptosporangium lutulentum TaxID=1461250 RepID=A0ABT9Q941_9ACTN|nr:hypothetical protein [Streptosporangium lutulentum]MDP9843265.1 hypothetical protein [Streptosporangium lutulentum]
MEPISSLSRPYLYIQVDGASGSEEVEIAFTNPGGEPAEDDWLTAEWASSTGTGARARILIGPGGAVALPDGTYMAWIRVNGAVERPVLPSGLVPIT